MFSPFLRGGGGGGSSWSSLLLGQVWPASRGFFPGCCMKQTWLHPGWWHVSILAATRGCFPLLPLLSLLHYYPCYNSHGPCYYCCRSSCCSSRAMLLHIFITTTTTTTHPARAMADSPNWRTWAAHMVVDLSWACKTLPTKGVRLPIMPFLLRNPM